MPVIPAGIFIIACSHFRLINQFIKAHPGAIKKHFQKPCKLLKDVSLLFKKDLMREMSINFNIMKTKILFYVIILLLSVNLPIYSQFADNVICGDTSTASLSFPYGIPHITDTQGEALRVAIIYVTFPDDEEGGYGYTIWEHPQGDPPQATQPDISLIDDTEGNPQDPPLTRYSAYTLSDFFCEMSLRKI